MADTKTQLKNKIEAALNFDSEKSVADIGTPAQARARLAQNLADAFEAYVVTRTVNVAGVQPGSGSVTGIIN
ncbi:hypothetical protein [Maribacter sp. ACAM166]|uniref:hypothetical protein n=1 Tax=Maribacter sp. ACAM166 TaxID=2508996 RepID=UPI0010FDB234|nr:hypothetical protein [Maribacter sp. ACAM166]TLP81351.1 hypothetical protein ES765_04915 [Maribacter sp. ACAM166]